MPASPTLARPAPRVPTHGPDVVSAFVFIVLAAALLVAVSSLLFDRARVDVEVENPTGYEITVGVRPADGGSVLLLGTLSPGASKTFTGVLDQGDRWHFDFSYAGVDAGTVEVSAADATREAVVVPDAATGALRDADLGPSPG